MILTMIHSHDDIFKSVKEETTYLAERTFDNEGSALFEKVVFDEEYLTLFRDLFLEGQANIDRVIMPYIREMRQEDEGAFDNQNFDEDRDYIRYMKMPYGFPSTASKPLSVNMKSYLVAYVIYRWLETKLPNEAIIHQKRADAYLDGIKHFIESRDYVMRTKGQLF